uniref:Integrase catalytic domain-containing protein n=1 Tax=Phytophthora ramorum TaxID=164328 RepID=H3H3Q1_PHYRM
MSCLGGRARSWAYGRRLTDPTCFSTYEDFKEELKLAFEPPQNEFRSRAEFLDLQQGKHDVHAYAQRARYLVSNIVTNPIDEATKVVTFMKGLRDGPVKIYLFRGYPNTLEAAIALAMQEEFSLRQAKLHVNAPRLMPRPVKRPSGGPEPMDLSSATAAGPQQRRGSTNGPAGRPAPAGDAIERVDIGHAAMKIAAPSESQSHCKKQDDKPNLVILKKEFVDELIVLELDDKFDMVLGMPCKSRHDPVIDWTKRTITPIPRKDVIIDSKTSSTIFSTLDLRDEFYQILMRESDIPLTAVSTPSGMLWEWLVMPQGLKNAPATFNRCVTHLLRSVRDFAPSYFDDVFIHSRAVNGKSDVEMHTEHLRKLLELMRKHKLYANLKKCIFGATEIPVLGCLVGKNGELRQFLGLATYLCKYVSNYAGKIRPLSQLLKKEAAWEWTADCQQAFEAVKQGLTEAPILAVADQDRPFHVVEYKPGRLNVVADALSRRPDYVVQEADANAVGVVRTTTPSSSLLDEVKAAYAHDADAKQLLEYFSTPSDKSRQKLAKHLRARVHRYRVHNGLLVYSAVDDNADRIVVPDDHELKLKITYEYHDAPTSGHPGREKTYLLLTRDFYWSHQYKWVRKYVRACELSMSTADHPQTDGQTERVNRVLVDTMKNYAHSFHQWSDCLPMAEFAINNSVHVSTGHTPFYVNAMRHPRVPSVLGAVAPSFSGGGYPVNLKQPDKHADTSNVSAVTTRARTGRSHGDDKTVSTTGVDTLNDNEHHAQAGPAANKEHELNQGFSSDAMDFVQRRQAVIRS